MIPTLTREEVWVTSDVFSASNFAPPPIGISLENW